MPVPGKPNIEKEQVHHVEIWVCPKCGAKHQWDSKNGCHKPGCKYQGKLTKEKW